MSFKTALPTSYNEKMFSKLQAILDKNELCSIICAPISGREYRIQDFLDWQSKNKIRQAQFIHLQINLINHPEDMQKLFEQSTSSMIISPGETLLETDMQHILTALTHYKNIYHKGILIFFEAQPSQLQQINQVAGHKLLQNVLVIPLLSFEDSQHFCLHIAKRWNISVSIGDIEAIYSYTGGHMWLIKEILRQLCKKEQLLSQIFTCSDLNIKKRKIWDQLPNEHKNYLINRVQKNNGRITQTDLIENDLRSLGFILNASNTIPEFITQLAKTTQINIKIENENIYFNDVNVSMLFSKNEQKILFTFLNAPNNRVDRETLAKCVWQSDDESEYSDWALDKIISRFRKKLISLGIPQTALVTLRQQGYQLQLRDI